MKSEASALPTVPEAAWADEDAVHPEGFDGPIATLAERADDLRRLQALAERRRTSPSLAIKVWDGLDEQTRTKFQKMGISPARLAEVAYEVELRARVANEEARLRQLLRSMRPRLGRPSFDSSR